MTPPVNPRKLKQLNVRIPAELYAQLKVAAFRRHRKLGHMVAAAISDLLWREAVPTSPEEFRAVVEKSLE
jgi:hypothetical protein